jgi:predicted DNA-binding transcriptional regulator YafY
MPPLLFTTGEATAVALGLLAARRDGLDADGALAKLHRVLPDRVRLRVEALEQTLQVTGRPRSAAPPSGEHLLLLAEAVVRGRRVQARYTSSAGVESERELSPYGLVAHDGRWYVPAYDHGRGEPRALRADRFGAVRLNGPGEPPPHDFDAVAFVGRTLARVPWTHEVEVVLELPLETVTARFPPALAELEAGGERTVLRMRAEALDWVAGLLAGLGCDFTVVRPAELRDSLAKLADRLSLAARSGGRIRPERGC